MKNGEERAETAQKNYRTVKLNLVSEIQTLLGLEKEKQPNGDPKG